MKAMRSLVQAGAASLLLAGAALAAPSAPNAALSGPSLAPIALNSLSSPPDNIATAKVVDDKGIVVGAVQKVDLDQAGKPTRVEIALLGSNRIIALDSASLSYDQANNVMTAAMDKTQLVQLPAAG